MMSKASDVKHLEAPWSLDRDAVLDFYSVSVARGLDEADVRRRRREYGPNQLHEPKSQSLWLILFAQVKSLIVALLAVAAIASMCFGQWVEAFAILAVIAINTAIGFVTELRAVRSMEALRQLGGARVVVRRQGETKEINADWLVPGDIVVLDAGDSINADLRLIEASKLQADESALTGESIPVSKRVACIQPDTVLAERSNMLFKGTFVSRGTGEAVVVSTGMDTELGRISSLVEQAAKDELTPLEKRLDRLGRELIWITLCITTVVALLGIVRGQDILLMIETGVALAVAAIPEGLPIVATLALARGMLRMARRNVLIRRLAAVETLGATNVICTDKTGTLTENRMIVTRVLLDSGSVSLGHPGAVHSAREETSPETSRDATLREALEIGVLCNNASLSKSEDDGSELKGTGDPMEVALLIAGAELQIDRADLIQLQPEVSEVAFDPVVKMMATFHQDGNQLRVAVKGAPEAVLEASTHVRIGGESKLLTDDERRKWLKRNTEIGALGLRVLAVATKTANESTEPAYRDLTLLGLVAMEDPPRQDVQSSIDACRKAGIRLVMVTGDQPVTARKIAADVGLTDHELPDVIHGNELDELIHGPAKDMDRIVETAVFARVSPKQKLDLIEAHQRNGSIVAMTGDGVNDAPALEKANIGVAMGKRGTQVAREASDMVLEDDALSSIVVAVRQGRIIFGNIRKFVLYLLSCNTSEVMVVALASLVNAPLPILPLQILFLNLITDVFPALALGVGPGSDNVMKRSPRDPTEPFLPTSHWWAIAGYAVVIAFSVLLALAVALLVLDMEEKRAVTVSFLTLALAQLWHVFNMRDRGAGAFNSDVTRNRYVWGAVALCIVLITAGVYLPGLSQVLQVESPGWDGWALALGLSLVPLIVGTILHYALGLHRIPDSRG